MDQVAERSGGRVKITGFWDSVLGNNMEIMDQVKMGELDFYYGQPSGAVDPRFGIPALPYSFASTDEIIKIGCNPDGESTKIVRKWMAENDLHLLGIGLGAVRGLQNIKQRVRTPADAKNLKLRVPQEVLAMEFWRRVANPTPIALSELYSALQTKTVEGSEQNATAIVYYKFHEICKFFSDIDWQWNYNATLLMSSKVYSTLPEDLRKIIDDCGRESMLHQTKMEREMMETAYEELKKGGVDVYRLTPEERQAWVAVAKEVEPKIIEIVGEAAYKEYKAAVEADRKNL
jgi:TRAP-type C4-dicarboxylate transport system substrate-binding protein